MTSLRPLEDTQGAVSVTAQHAIRPLTHRDFRLLTDYLYKEAGIHLPDTKQALVSGRLQRRLRTLGIAKFSEYYEFLLADTSGAEKVQFLDAMCTNETSFFREPRHFSWLSQEVFPQLRAEASAGRRACRVRAWSAACSTGEEPYSLAMTMLDYFGLDSSWALEILATDLSTKVLKQAEGAVWPIQKKAQIPTPLLKRFMLQGTRSQEGIMRAGQEIRSLIQFRRLNLNHEAANVNGPFDLIFCRNVLIYFDGISRRKLLETLLDKLSPGGYLFLGHAESLNGVNSRAKAIMPTVYRRTHDSQS
jgi:chemotaxis protein methyltransferase CheR